MTTAESSGQVDPIESEHEIVDGRVLDCPGWWPYPGALGTRLGIALGNHTENQSLGRTLIRALYRLDDGNHRRPSVAFVSYKRWPKGRRVPWGDSWDVVPDLAVEVLGQPSDACALLKKVRQYFAAGVRFVWIIYPLESVVHVYDSFTSIRVLTRADILDGGKVIPGFRLSLDTFFEDDEPDSPGESSDQPST